MENNNPPTPIINQSQDLAAISPQINQSSPGTGTDNRQQVFEYVMLSFGLVTVLSLVTRNGFLLKIGICLFLIVAIISIIRSLLNSKNRATANLAQGATQPKTKTNKIWKILGITLLALIIVPILGQMLFMGFIIVLLIFNGGSMGT